MLASFTQVVFLRVYSFSGSCVTNEGTEVQNGLYPGELLVCVCVDLSSSFPSRSGPSLEVWVRPVPPSFLSGSQGRCGRNSCRARKAQGFLPGQTWVGKKNFFFLQWLWGCLQILGGMQDSFHHYSELVFIERDS